MKRIVQIVICLCLILPISSCELIVLQSPKDEVAVFAYAYPLDVSSGPQTYEIYVVITRGDRTYSNADVKVNGSELVYQEFADDQDNGFYIVRLNDISQGNNISLEVGFPLIGLIEKSLQIPYGIPEFTLDPPLPEPGVPIDPDLGPSRYDLTISSITPENTYIITWVDSYDHDSNYITSYNDIPENDLSQFVNGPVMDMNNDRYPYLAFSAQHLVYSAIEDWHPESGFFVYGYMAPFVTNLDSRNFPPLSTAPMRRIK